MNRQREFFAIPIVLVIVGIFFLLFAAASVGLWAWLLVGAIGLAVLALLLWSYARRHRHPAARAAPHVQARSRDPSVHRVLIIVDDRCVPEALHAAIREHAEGRRAEAFVIAPSLASRLDGWTGDQSAYDAARNRLEATVETLEANGVVAQGRIGPHDPLQAADDGLREFVADEIVIAVHAEGTANWLERDVLEAARGRYDVPITPLVIDG